MKKSKNVKKAAPKAALKPVAKPKTNLPAIVNASVPVAKIAPKTASKAPVKGVVIKKHLLYVEVTPDKYFILCDGRKVKSAKELADVLQLINDDMFRYHVTDTKNDFSNWINDVFGETDLAKKIRGARNRLDMSIELYREMYNKLDKAHKAKK